MKFLYVILALSLVSATSYGAKKRRKRARPSSYGPAGCGLGSRIFKDKSGLMFNTMAATTNGTSGNQTFGMSSGTLGCKGDTRVAAVNFIETNKVALANDVAKGNGETLEAFLELINEDANSVAAMRKDYDNIFVKSTTSDEVWTKIEAVL